MITRFIPLLTTIMRTLYQVPSSEDYDEIFAIRQRGGGINDIKFYKLRGGSIFNVLGSLVKRSIPFLTKYVLPEALSFSNNVANELGHTPFRKNIKNNLAKSAKNIGRKILKGGRKAKNHLKKKKNINPQRKRKQPKIKKLR